MMLWILELMGWAVIVLGTSLAFGIAMGNFIRYGSAEDAPPPPWMPQKD